MNLYDLWVLFLSHGCAVKAQLNHVIIDAIDVDDVFACFPSNSDVYEQKNVTTLARESRIS
jgi:hypothetical protein